MQKTKQFLIDRRIVLSNQQIAQLYMFVKQPAEAAKIFQANPTTQVQAEEAFFAGYEATTDVKEKKDLLLQGYASKNSLNGSWSCI